MKIDTLHPFQLDELYAFYDAFICRSGSIVAVAPMYDLIDGTHEDIRCIVEGHTLTPRVQRDPHGHTIIITFVPPTHVSVQKVTFTFRHWSYTCDIHRSSDTPKYCVAATQLQNCAPFVKTWIEYHMSIGIEYFYIYDNNSQDVEYLKRNLAPYPVTYIRWPYPYGIPKKSGLSGQTCAQNHALYKYDHAFVALTDVDEYIHSTKSSLMKELQKVDINTHSGILMCCQWFGCAKKEPYTPDDFLEKLVYRKNGPQTHKPGHGPKSIVSPRAVDIFSVHRVSKGKPMIHIDADTLRFNHYFTLTIDVYRKHKSRKSVCACDTLDAVHDDALAKAWKDVRTRKYVFISIPKNGSQSVCSMLGYKIKDRSKDTDHGIMDNHARGVVLKERYRDFDTRFKFCFVRHPVERLVSWYDHHKKVYKCEPYMSHSFKEWIMKGCPHHWKKQNGTHWIDGLSPIHQWQFIYDDGVCMVDRIFRMESFDDHFEEACNMIGVSPPEKKTHKNKATVGSWKDRYDEESLAHAKVLVEKDMRLFGYT